MRLPYDGLRRRRFVSSHSPSESKRPRDAARDAPAPSLARMCWRAVQPSSQQDRCPGRAMSVKDTLRIVVHQTVREIPPVTTRRLEPLFPGGR